MKKQVLYPVLVFVASFMAMCCASSVNLYAEYDAGTPLYMTDFVLVLCMPVIFAGLIAILAFAIGRYIDRLEETIAELRESNASLVEQNDELNREIKAKK